MTINDIIRLAGGAQRLARELGVLHQAIYKWERVPSARVLDVCRLTGLRPYDVRADLYPDPRWTL